MTETPTADELLDLSDVVAPRKPGPGRPTPYRPEFAAQARKLCELIGATDCDLGYFFGVSPNTIRKWKAKHPLFGTSCVVGKSAADDRVERSFYQRAVGFTVESEKIFMPAGAQEPVRVKTREYFPPDTAAGMFWLKNRRAEQWRDRKEVGIGGEKPGSPITVQDIPASMTDADLAYLALLG